MMDTDAAILTATDALIASVGGERERAIALLTALQDRFHYLPRAAMERICAVTEISPAQLYGVATFYAYFRLRPAGEHRIKVCVGTACHVKGAGAVCDAFRRHLGIEGDADTDADGLFTVEQVACLGCCMLAPAVQIDRTVYGPVASDGVADVLRDFLASRADSEPPLARVAGARAGEVRLCRCTSCAAAGADAAWDALARAIARDGLAVRLKEVGCVGSSFEAPLVEVAVPDGRRFRYGQVKPDDAETLLSRHFQATGLVRRVCAACTTVLDRWMAGVEGQPPPARYAAEVRDVLTLPYWRRQQAIALEGAGELDPLDLAAYRERGGLEALARCGRDVSPEAVIDLIAASGLRGRGGGGYATGAKWRQVGAAKGPVRYVVCNADEGDPGSFMDRMILESFPFRVLEGMAIAAHAVGAGEGIVYVRSEYPLAVSRLREAIRLAIEAGWLGKASFDVRVVEGAGAFVCGEETALLAALEGRRGMPRVRPPFPSESGLHGCPTLVNNVETFAAVPWIVAHGAEAFRGMGTHGSPGTKTFALAGRIVRGGMIEVPMGTTLREIVEDIGGGVGEGRVFKAAQIGGPSGGCVPAHLADTPVDFDALQSVGSMMGSGGLIILDATDCMVDIARYFLSFTQSESCGKCTFCRVGTKRMLEIMERLCGGAARPDDLDQLQTLAVQVRQGSLCGLGRTAPNPILSCLEHFRSEFEAHARGRCPVRRCKALIAYSITDACIGCTRCAQHCPVDAIAFQPYERHRIDESLCIRCNACREVCPVDAVEVVDKLQREDAEESRQAQDQDQ